METEILPHLPHNKDAERTILGACLFEGTVVPDVAHLSGEEFYVAEHRVVFKAILDLHGQGLPTDTVAISDLLGQQGGLNDAVDAAYLASLMDDLGPNVANCVRLVQRDFTRRTSIRLLEDAQKAATEGQPIDSYLQKLAAINSTSSNGNSRIQAWEAIPMLKSLPRTAIPWTVERLVPAGAITLLAAEPGTYKTWLGLMLTRSVATATPFLGFNVERSPVLYLDAENPLALIRDRATILEVEDGESLRIWGGWLKDPPPQIGDPRLLEIARCRRPLMIFDSLIRFHKFDENSPTEMSRVMGHLRTLANAGATVFVLHHRGKAEGVKYRGASEIHAGSDVAYSLSLDRKSGLLTLSCFKNRFAEEFDLTLRPNVQESGNFEVTDSPKISNEQADVKALADLIAGVPGLNQSDLIERANLPKARVRSLLERYDGRAWRTERGNHNARRLYPIENDVAAL